MLFNSLEFLIFLPVVIVVYMLTPVKLRYLWLLIASYYFYMNWNAGYGALLFASTLITYLSAIIMQRVSQKHSGEKEHFLRKVTLTVSLTLNLLLLGFFKYFYFVFGIATSTADMLGYILAQPAFNIILPVGISFFIIQAIGYTIDVYRKDIQAEQNFFRYALFVSFFPQLVAGPIERSKNILPQLRELQDIKWDDFIRGASLMLFGLFQKVVIADRLAIFVNAVYGDIEGNYGFTLLFAMFFFTFQIFCDFAAYSTIAIGVAKIFGITLMQNFNRPYLATSITDLWRRRHISLSTWFKDYLYVPLGGSRAGELRTYLNIMIVFLVSGLWHGASFNFIIWGGMHGLLLVLERASKKSRERLLTRFNINKKAFSNRLIATICTFSLVNFTLVFFRSESFSDTLSLLKKLPLASFNQFVNGSIFELGLNKTEFVFSILLIVLLMAVEIASYKSPTLFERFARQPAFIRLPIYVFFVICIVVFGVYGSGDTSQFIYFQF